MNFRAADSFTTSRPTSHPRAPLPAATLNHFNQPPAPSLPEATGGIPVQGNWAVSTLPGRNTFQPNSGLDPICRLAQSSLRGVAFPPVSTAGFSLPGNRVITYPFFASPRPLFPPHSLPFFPSTGMSFPPPGYLYSPLVNRGATGVGGGVSHLPAIESRAQAEDLRSRQGHCEIPETLQVQSESASAEAPRPTLPRVTQKAVLEEIIKMRSECGNRTSKIPKRASVRNRLKTRYSGCGYGLCGQSFGFFYDEACRTLKNTGFMQEAQVTQTVSQEQSGAGTPSGDKEVDAPIRKKRSSSKNSNKAAAKTAATSTPKKPYLTQEVVTAAIKEIVKTSPKFADKAPFSSTVCEILVKNYTVGSRDGKLYTRFLELYQEGCHSLGLSARKVKPKASEEVVLEKIKEMVQGETDSQFFQFKDKTIAKLRETYCVGVQLEKKFRALFLRACESLDPEVYKEIDPKLLAKKKPDASEEIVIEAIKETIREKQSSNSTPYVYEHKTLTLKKLKKKYSVRKEVRNKYSELFQKAWSSLFPNRTLSETYRTVTGKRKIFQITHPSSK